MKLNRQQPRLVERVERIDRPASGMAVGFPRSLKLVRHPWIVLVDGSPFQDHAAGGRLDQIAHRHNERIDLELLFIQDLVDILADPRRLDDVGKVGAGNQQVLEAGVGLRVPTRPIPVSGQDGVQAKLGQIADQKTRSRPAGAGNDEMSFLFLIGRIELRFVVERPLPIRSIKDSGPYLGSGWLGSRVSPPRSCLSP